MKQSRRTVIKQTAAAGLAAAATARAAAPRLRSGSRRNPILAAPDCISASEDINQWAPVRPLSTLSPTTSR